MRIDAESEMTGPTGMLISPAAYVIRKMGGLTKTAKALGLAVSTVQGWQERGRIPQDHWDALIDAAKADDKIIDVRDFLRQHEIEESAA